MGLFFLFPNHLSLLCHSKYLGYTALMYRIFWYTKFPQHSLIINYGSTSVHLHVTF